MNEREVADLEGEVNSDGVAYRAERTRVDQRRCPHCGHWGCQRVGESSNSLRKGLTRRRKCGWCRKGFNTFERYVFVPSGRGDGQVVAVLSGEERDCA